MDDGIALPFAPYYIHSAPTAWSVRARDIFCDWKELPATSPFYSIWNTAHSPLLLFSRNICRSHYGRRQTFPSLLLLPLVIASSTEIKARCDLERMPDRITLHV